MADHVLSGALAAGALFASAGGGSAGEAPAATGHRTNAIETAVKNRVIEYMEHIGCGKRKLRGAG